MFWRTSHGNL
jgi:hypothetical protein